MIRLSFYFVFLSTFFLNATELKRDGWNLIAICEDMNRSNLNMNQIQEIQSQEGNSIYTGEWKQYSNLAELEAGYAYWVKGELNSTFNSGMSTTVLNKPLKRTGWNLMASCEDINSNDINMTGIKEIQAQNGDSIYTGDDSNFSNLLELDNGYGYWIRGNKNKLFTSNRNLDKNTSSITINGISLHATFHNVGIQVNYTGDSNKNAKTKVETNINGKGFHEVHELSRVFLVSKVSENYPQRFVGSIFSLDAQSNVEVRVTISDSDGVVNAVQTASIVTRSKEIPCSLGVEIHVAIDGNDSTGTGSEEKPFQSIQHAVNQLAAGQSVLIHAGRYHEQINIAYNGQNPDQAYMTIQSAGDGEVILDGTDKDLLDGSTWKDEGNNLYSATFNSLNNDTYYVGFDGNRLWKYFSLQDLKGLIHNTDGGFFTDRVAQKVFVKLPKNSRVTGHQLSVSNLKYAFQMDNVNNIVINGLTFDNYNSDEHSALIHVTNKSEKIWIVNSKFLHSETAIRLEAKVVDLVVMNNEFSDQGIQAFDWDIVKEHQHWLERGALYCSNDEYSGYGSIFYNNYVHNYFDGIKIVGTEILTYPSNSDVEHNRFVLLSDDGVETDGYSSNVRIQHNYFETMLVGVSVAPALAGPTYITRNFMVDLKNIANSNYAVGAVKFSIGDEVYGDIFIYHNTGTTTESNREAFSVSNEANWSKVLIKNNIWSGQSYGIYYYLDNADELNLEQDYDLLYAISGIAAQYQGEDYYDVIDYFKASGICEHCIEENPFLTQNYTLQANSPAIDKGILIKGINDNYVDEAPDLGASEFTGEAIPTFYVSPEGSDVNDGSKDKAWKSIQASIDKIEANSILILKEGIYHESILFLGEEDSNIVLKGEVGAVLDGTGITPIGSQALIEIKNAHHIVVENLEIRNFKTATGLEINDSPIGIFIHGSSHDINISKNNIHHIENLSTCGESSGCGTGANGIAAYGDSIHTMTNLNFIDNEISNCILSASEAFTLNGNINGFRILNNYVHDNNNIGIVIIGYEEDTCIACTPENNRARNGIVKGNRAINNSTNLALGNFTNNPWYEGSDGSAGGFYVDGGHHVIFDGNYASQNDLGFEFASEHSSKSSNDILMINNYISNNREVGLSLGGYEEDSTKQGGGNANNIMILNNSFYKNAGWGSEIAFSFRVKNTSIINNIIYGETSIADNFSQEENAQLENITWGKNLWWAEDTSDTSGIQGEVILSHPLYIDPDNNNLNLQDTSPAKEEGSLQTNINSWNDMFWQKEFLNGNITVHGVKDIQGDIRVNGILDLGADEL
jgi:hypothetical protein